MVILLYGFLSRYGSCAGCFFFLVDVGGSVLRTRASFFAGCLGPDVSLKASAWCTTWSPQAHLVLVSQWLLATLANCRCNSIIWCWTQGMDGNGGCWDYWIIPSFPIWSTSKNLVISWFWWEPHSWSVSPIATERNGAHGAPARSPTHSHQQTLHQWQPWTCIILCVMQMCDDVIPLMSSLLYSISSGITL